jgi:TRAP-type C4-dicarboxylate transport system substrate-binding protein
MKKLKRLMIGGLALAIIVSLVAVACAPPAPPEGEKPSNPTYHFKLAQPNPAESPSTIASIAFAKAVLEASDGRIVIDVYHSAQLGDWVPVTGEVMRGTIEMAITWQPAVYDPRADFMNLPYLTITWDEAFQTLGREGAIQAMFADIGRGLGYETVGVFPDGFCGIITSKAIPSPADPDVAKPLKIRIWASRAADLAMSRLGFTTTVIPLADVYTAMQMGVVDGLTGSEIVVAYYQYRDVMKYFYAYNWYFYCDYTIINMDLWNNLSAQDQKILWDAGAEMERIQDAAAVEQEKAYAQKMRDYGIEVIFFTDEELAKMAAVMMKDVWPELEPMLGKKLIDDAAAIVKAMR